MVASIKTSVIKVINPRSAATPVIKGLVEKLWGGRLLAANKKGVYIYIYYRELGGVGADNKTHSAGRGPL